MTEEDGRNYHSIVPRRWKEIKEDPARVSACNDKARQMKNEAEKPAKAGDDLSVGSMEQQTVTERPVVKRIHKLTKKAPKSPEFVDTDSDDSDTKDEEEQKPVVKRPQKVWKSLEWFEDDPTNEEEEPHSQRMFPGPLAKELIQSVKAPSAASHTTVTPCTHILTSGLREGKQCKLKASDETGKFCHLQKRQT